MLLRYPEQHLEPLAKFLNVPKSSGSLGAFISHTVRWRTHPPRSVELPPLPNGVPPELQAFPANASGSESVGKRLRERGGAGLGHSLPPHAARQFNTAFEGTRVACAEGDGDSLRCGTAVRVATRRFFAARGASSSLYPNIIPKWPLSFP